MEQLGVLLVHGVLQRGKVHVVGLVPCVPGWLLQRRVLGRVFSVLCGLLLFFGVVVVQQLPARDVLFGVRLGRLQRVLLRVVLGLWVERLQ